MNNKNIIVPSKLRPHDRQEEISPDYKDPQEKVPPHLRHPSCQSGRTTEEIRKENQVTENHIFETKWESETSGLVTKVWHFCHSFGQAAQTPSYLILSSAQQEQQCWPLLTHLLRLLERLINLSGSIESSVHAKNSSGSPHAVVGKNYKAHHVAGNWGVKGCPSWGRETLNEGQDEKNSSTAGKWKNNAGFIPSGTMTIFNVKSASQVSVCCSLRQAEGHPGVRVCVAEHWDAWGGHGKGVSPTWCQCQCHCQPHRFCQYRHPRAGQGSGVTCRAMAQQDQQPGHPANSLL